MGRKEARPWQHRPRPDAEHNLRLASTEKISLADASHNEGVIADLRIRLSSSREPWRLITFRHRRNRSVEFLANDVSLLPGALAFPSSRRWDEDIEKCFDT